VIKVETEKTSLSNVLKSTRLNKNMSLSVIAKYTGISPSYLHRLEIGERKQPSVQAIAKIAKALDLDLIFLVNLILEEEVGAI
jgi:transcriptional regulator with XRE-family HTH domain